MCSFQKEIKQGIESIPGLEQSQDRLWIKLSADFFGLDKDVYLQWRIQGGGVLRVLEHPP